MYAVCMGHETNSAHEIPDAETMLAAMRGGFREGAREVSATRPQIARVRYTHEAMIEEIIMRPEIHQNELAAIFGFSPAWISTVINSDAFQAKLMATKDELVNPELRLQLNERFRALSVRSVQVLMEKLSKPANEISDNLALKAAELGAKALGLGAVSPAVVVVNSVDRLQGLASRLTGLIDKGTVVDVEVREVPEGNAGT